MISNIIQTNKHCNGCFACSNICPVSAIKMEKINGFYKPVIDENKCINCKLCVKTCPQNDENIISDKQLKAYACINKDEDIRNESSSGGIFYLLSEKIISLGGVVYGVIYDSNSSIRHYRITKKEDIKLLMKSKYGQSYVGNTYKEIKNDLNNDKFVLFSGTPCQCDALNHYLKKKYEKLFIVEVLCHGNPSPVVWENYINYRKNKSKSESNPYYINLRAKNEEGFSWQKPCTVMKFNNSHNYCVNTKLDMYMFFFVSSNMILNRSCYDCKYRNKFNFDYCDISLADFWKVESILPEYDNSKGCSLVIIHTKNGQKMLDLISNNILYKEVDVNIALKNNGSSTNPIYHKYYSNITKKLCENYKNFPKIYYSITPFIYSRKLIKRITGY